MKKFYFAISLLIILYSCKDAKTNLAGTEKVSAEDFLKSFKTLNPPVFLNDTGLIKLADSTVISKSVFEQFVPDSALSVYADSAIIHPVGMIDKKDKDFLLATFTSGKKIQLGVFALDDKHTFLASMPLIDNQKKESYTYSVNITDEPTFIVKKEKITAYNNSLYSRNGFAYSSVAHSFSVVLHDSNEDTARMNQVINPIDTFPQLRKYSSDYITDKKDFISVRDGKNEKTYVFFVHFEKNKDKCGGELKGVMTMTGDKEAVFTENGDPCVVDFKFTSNSIKIKEQGNCGNHRGITCSFDFTFKKKVEEKKILK